jgi:hypothetical protein
MPALGVAGPDRARTAASLATAWLPSLPATWAADICLHRADPDDASAVFSLQVEWKAVICRSHAPAATGKEINTMRRLSVLSAVALALAFGASLGQVPQPALAHEHRDVAGGKYDFTVGFITEPALQNEPNGIDLTITDKATGQPVEGAEKTLKAAIAFGGGQPKELPLRARFRMPGKYTADLIPTRAGSYSFTFTGTVNGNQVSEKFESGPNTYNDVQAATALEFPSANPSPAELQQALNEARQQAATANSLAVAGLITGLLGLGLAGYLLLRGRSVSHAAAMATQGSRSS